jgi:hypothetical protein
MKIVANMKPDFNLMSTFLGTGGRVVRAQVAAIRGRWQSIFLFPGRGPATERTSGYPLPDLRNKHQQYLVTETTSTVYI